MANKIIELKDEAKIEQEQQVKIIAYFNARIDTDLSYINFSMQVIDKVLYSNNLELVKGKYNTFMSEIQTEALTSGWLMFKPVVVENLPPTETPTP